MVECIGLGNPFSKPLTPMSVSLRMCSILRLSEFQKQRFGRRKTICCGPPLQDEWRWGTWRGKSLPKPLTETERLAGQCLPQENQRLIRRLAILQVPPAVNPKLGATITNISDVSRIEILCGSNLSTNPTCQNQH